MTPVRALDVEVLLFHHHLRSRSSSSPSPRRLSMLLSEKETTQ
jgi:hypothetical protein